MFVRSCCCCFYQGNCFGCEHFLVRSESMLGEEDEEDLPYPPSSHNNRRLMNHDDAVLYGAYLSNITSGGSSRPSLDTVDDAGERRQCVGEAERMINVGERGCHHIQHQQQLILSQPPMSRHHLLQAFGSDGVIMEPAAALSPSEQSTDVICLSSHRSYAYPPPHPPATAYTHIATEGSALPMVGHPLRHQNHPGTTTPSIKSTAAACCALSADGSGRCEVVGDCQSRELETFAEHFKQRRIRLGATQADVGAALGKLKLAGVACLSQSTICRFESLTLSHSNMVALKPILAAWLADMERAARERRSALDVEAMHSGSNRLEDKRRKRTSIAGPEKRSLEAYFAIQPRPSGEKIVRIAEKLELRKDVVRVWFCNQRQKQKRMKFSSSC